MKRTKNNFRERERTHAYWLKCLLLNCAFCEQPAGYPALLKASLKIFTVEAAKNEINVMQNSDFAEKYPYIPNLHMILMGIFSPKIPSEKLTDKAYKSI